MRRESRIVALCVAGLGWGTFSQAAEEKISKADLPPAVLKTAKQHSKGAIVKGYTKDTENGQLEYEVEMTVEGRAKDITIAPDGRLLEVEEQVEMNSLSARVQSTLNSRADGGTISKIESITKSGKLVAYEAQVMKGGRHVEIQVGPGGERLQDEE